MNHIPEHRAACSAGLENACPCFEKSGTTTAEEKELLRAYLKHFHTGKSRAVPSRELEQLFDLDGRSIRRRISVLRQEGCPICSDVNGYFYAENQQEINETVGRLNGLVTGVSNARTGLLLAMLMEPVVKVDVTVRMEGREC